MDAKVIIPDIAVEVLAPSETTRQSSESSNGISVENKTLGKNDIALRYERIRPKAK